jgi:hypothetical protein
MTALGDVVRVQALDRYANELLERAREADPDSRDELLREALAAHARMLELAGA